MKPKPKPQQQLGEGERPEVDAGDEVFYQRMGSHCVGKVLCHGRHGFTIKGMAGPHVKVPWKDYLGHKARLSSRAAILDEGEDGALAQLANGKRKFLVGYQREETRKAFFLKAGPIKNKPGLMLQTTSDKAGHQVKRWKRSGEKPKSAAKRGYGTGDVDVGDTAHFDAGQGATESGRVMAVGSDGVTVATPHGHLQVRWDQMRKPPKGKKPSGGDKASDAPKDWRAEPGKKSAPMFSAKAHYNSTDDPNLSEEEIEAQLTDEQQQKITAARERLANLEQTVHKFKQEDGYTEARQALHNKIISSFLTPEKIAAARPAEGEQPTLTILGGRGGSGKSSFKGLVYDPAKSIVLDPDAIKEQLPEYQGWNAAQLHDESKDIFSAIKELAKREGLNIVLDATLSDPEKARKTMDEYRSAGYQVSAHFMHLSRKEAAKRALQRFFSKSGRLVPTSVILENSRNEESFDAIKDEAKEWSFWDNHGEAPPTLISHSKATGVAQQD